MKGKLIPVFGPDCTSETVTDLRPEGNPISLAYRKVTWLGRNSQDVCVSQAKSP